MEAKVGASLARPRRAAERFARPHALRRSTPARTSTPSSARASGARVLSSWMAQLWRARTRTAP
eukprot:9615046-Lingulodinium_polyedra.AAC.1